MPILSSPRRALNQSLICGTHNTAWELPIGLAGEHQSANAAVAVAAIEKLVGGGFPIDLVEHLRGIADVHWPARFEWFNTRPNAVLDCAHNVASAEALARTLVETSLPRN